MLRLESVSVAYGQSQVITDVSLEVPEGQVVCLMGRNGVGKTTLLKTIMGQLKARQGRAYFENADITGWPAHKRARAGIGYVPQGRHIFPYLSVHENLMLGLEALPPRQRDAAFVDEMYETFPALKLDPKKPGGTLSGGQQQQLAIARVLLRKPKLLLLDEPTEGIQPNIVQEIEDLIRRLKEERRATVLLVEQFIDFALGVADFCAVMEKGEIVLSGSSAAIDQDALRERLAV